MREKWFVLLKHWQRRIRSFEEYWEVIESSEIIKDADESRRTYNMRPIDGEVGHSRGIWNYNFAELD